MNDDDDYSKPGDPILPRAPRIGLRVSGARVGDAARPQADGAASGYGLASRRPMLRINSSRLAAVKPPGDDEAAS
jgi:hypothetical protein